MHTQILPVISYDSLEYLLFCLRESSYLQKKIFVLSLETPK